MSDDTTTMATGFDAVQTAAYLRERGWGISDNTKGNIVRWDVPEGAVAVCGAAWGPGCDVRLPSAPGVGSQGVTPVFVRAVPALVHEVLYLWEVRGWLVPQMGWQDAPTSPRWNVLFQDSRLLVVRVADFMWGRGSASWWVEVWVLVGFAWQRLVRGPDRHQPEDPQRWARAAVRDMALKAQPALLQASVAHAAMLRAGGA